jgi:hypothetical protein
MDDEWMDDGDFGYKPKIPTENSALLGTRLSYQTKVSQKSKHRRKKTLILTLTLYPVLDFF